MITTGCDGCCFFVDKDSVKGCSLNQLCVSSDKNSVIAPGYCRQCRSHQWAKKQKSNNPQDLLLAVVKENALRFDMLVLFDENIHSIEALKLTLDSDWYAKYANKVIIVDVTGFGNRKNIALEYLRDNKSTVPVTVDSSRLHESLDEKGGTIRRISKQVTSPFFLVISAGNRIVNMDALSSKVEAMPSRVIHWSFPLLWGRTAVVPYEMDHGLFLTKPYLSINKSDIEKSFSQVLREEEEEMKMRLSWFCSECGII